MNRRIVQIAVTAASACHAETIYALDDRGHLWMLFDPSAGDDPSDWCAIPTLPSQPLSDDERKHAELMGQAGETKQHARDQVWFAHPDVQQRMAEAHDDIAAGRVVDATIPSGVLVPLNAAALQRRAFLQGVLNCKKSLEAGRPMHPVDLAKKLYPDSPETPT